MLFVTDTTPFSQKETHYTSVSPASWLCLSKTLEEVFQTQKTYLSILFYRMSCLVDAITFERIFPVEKSLERNKSHTFGELLLRPVVRQYHEHGYTTNFASEAERAKGSCFDEPRSSVIRRTKGGLERQPNASPFA